ncbi:ATP-binding protein [Novosphingobium aerophilum]|uniref:ATP-binding protein n=1 Tax=Novosphingobium TaxID=165696 RepID=UPI0006C86F58|nr:MULTISPECIES: ATP-binding protein [unclassified Novosphingobium]KPH62075.1 histidine kinase [Novosphingobium sp. ST904]MPS70892.1 HAMP domain-containing protein [Novosphingobium sp.]TCM33136.1 signal transduction histidine kinase [Novosphingobium sp. ST904]WRT92700.1 ATP-binding protein [Novosphingobium sp. RL4]
MTLRRFRLFRRFGLPERLIAVLLLVFVIDVVCNTVLFERANTFELRRDDAQRIAENLVLASRAIDHSLPGDRQKVTAALSSPQFSLRLTEGKRYRGSLGLANLRAQIIEIAPELAHSDLELHLESIPRDGNIGGSLRLPDHSVLDFRTHARSAWKLSAGRLASLVLPTLLLITFAWILLRAALNPLRSLIRATRHLGAGPPRPVPERGPDEMRQLIRAMNEMQERIHQSLLDRTHTMLAIGHDLKTPLARMRLRLDDGEVDAVVRDGINHDIDEMRMLLDSIQAYVETGGTQIPAERIDLAIMAETLVDTAADRGANASYSGPTSLEIMARPVSIRRALSNLIENALHYGGNVRVSLRRDGDGAEITVDDDGPGIPEERIPDALQPFVRLDTARARDTAGMGLGLPIVRKAVRLEGGTLDLRNRPEGGLRATIRLPLGTR